jgi:hypothetical protein
VNNRYFHRLSPPRRSTGSPAENPAQKDRFLALNIPTAPAASFKTGCRLIPAASAPRKQAPITYLLIALNHIQKVIFIQ